MNPARFEWQTRCGFNAYCKRTLRNELIDASRERKRRQRREVTFSNLTPHEEKYTYKYTDTFGKPQFVYAWKLVPTDKTPAGKREDISLREKEKEIQKDLPIPPGTGTNHGLM